MWEFELSSGDRPIGYRALVERFGIRAISHFRWSYISMKWDKREVFCEADLLTLHFYPPSYAIEDEPFRHLEFALKHEGIHLFILKRTLELLGADVLTRWLHQAPTSKYTRILWFLYEHFFSTQLDLPDLKRGSYVSFVDPEEYYTALPERSVRHRVLSYLPGPFSFCPLVRKTKLLQAFEAKKLAEKASVLASAYSPEVLARAMQYLYTKETRSSWEIEREQPDKIRLARFATLLQKASQIGPLSKGMLIDLQKAIVDSRFAASDYRDFQNYVGEERRLGEVTIHYLAPRPADVELLMQGLLHYFDRMAASNCCPVISAAVLSFGFVFIHPFEDGNGRLHRFLIHYALARSGFTPPQVVFPISATMVRELRAYDAALESFSVPLKTQISRFELSPRGELTILEDTADYYRYMDLTHIAEYLFSCVEKTIDVDFREELQFLTQYYEIKKRLKEIVDMPDSKLDLFIQCVRQNQGHLSAKKRESHFDMLTESEIQHMEQIING